MIKGEVKYRSFLFHRLHFFSLKFVGPDFVVSVISSHVIIESSIILAEYLLFLELHVAGLQI